MSFRPKFILPILLVFLPTVLFSQSSLWTAHESDTVDWKHWSPEAVQEAKATDKPLFFFVAHYGNSLARSMLSETFQNKTIAQTLNDSAVPVLIDINEQPELAALISQLALEHFSANELPTCLWTDTTLAPLNGGGYFPPTDDWGGQGFLSVARNVSDQWQTNRTDYLSPAQDRLKKSLSKSPATLEQLSKTSGVFSTEAFSDKETPTLSAIDFYTTARFAKTQSTEESTKLTAALQGFVSRITTGGGFDSIDGGFFIGSNDKDWKLPLFQKSTSDQAYMLLGLSELYDINPKPEYKEIARLTIEFIERDLLKANGLAIQYLDSFAPGETPDMVEGSYYLLTGGEVSNLPSKAVEAWGLSKDGNLSEETDILGIYKSLNVPFGKSAEILSSAFDSERAELRSLRATKKTPLSDKIGYTSTNALLVRALAHASESMNEPYYLELAAELFENTLSSNFSKTEKTFFNSDQKTLTANSNDYAQLTAAALALESTPQGVHFLDTAKLINKIWNEDNRYDGENQFALKNDILGFAPAIFTDSTLESPVVLHLENLKALSTSQPELTENLPSLATNKPSHFGSLYLFATQSASQN